jgi:hypothetical protein
MRTLVTAQQTRLFTQNSYIELGGIPCDIPRCFQEIDQVMSVRSSLSYASGRDVWRDSHFLQNLLLKTLHSTLSSLLPKTLRLACDQWIAKGTLFPQKTHFKDLFSIQGLEIGFFIAKEPTPSLTPSSLGLSPFPKEEGNILFVKPNILIDLPLVQSPLASDLYFAGYALENGVYVYNEKDPATHLLKNFGYHFGDRLKNSFHPLLSR